jgi:hypothetical protein
VVEAGSADSETGGGFKVEHTHSMRNESRVLVGRYDELLKIMDSWLAIRWPRISRPSLYACSDILGR